ncbi:MAG: hypothetical protein WCT14_05015, partial [Treponemataceae bacterium]
MATDEALVLEEILRSSSSILQKDMLMVFFREAARTTEGDSLRTIWDDLFAFNEYLARVQDSNTLETLPYWQYSLAIEWIDSHFIDGDSFEKNLANAKRFLGNIGRYYDYLVSRGVMSGRTELDRAIRELCGGKRLKLVKEIPYAGEEDDHEVQHTRDRFGAEEAESPPELLSAAELKRRHALLKLYDKGDPWQEDGGRFILPLRDALKKHAESLSTFPKQFVPMAIDQYLAALWHSVDGESDREKHRRTRAGDKEYESAYELFNEEPWLYAAFVVLEDLGEGRYLCMDDEEASFMLYSPSMANTLKEGSITFLSVLLSIGDDWYMTHGPILGWNGISLGDIGSFASCIARQRYENDGLDAVVCANPVPFWALWKYANIPPVFDGDEPVVYCSLRGKLSPEFEANLPRTWRREDAGKKTRWVYGTGKNVLNRRYVYLNGGKGYAYLAAFRIGDFEKLLKFARPYFSPSRELPVAIGALMAMIQKEMLGAEAPL